MRLKDIRNALKRGLVAIAAVVATVTAVTLQPAPAAAEVRIDITRGKVEPLPIAVVPFNADDQQVTQLARDLSGVIVADLERSGLFAPINDAAFIQRDVPMNAPPRFMDWRSIAAQALVHGEVQPQPDGRVRIAYRLWDVFAENQMAGQAYTTQTGNWRRIAHIIADDIYERVTASGDISTPASFMWPKAASGESNQTLGYHGSGRCQSPLLD